MTINKKKNGTSLTLSLEGRLDTITAPDLEAVLKEELDNVEALTFDLPLLIISPPPDCVSSSPPRSG